MTTWNLCFVEHSVSILLQALIWMFCDVLHNEFYKAWLTWFCVPTGTLWDKCVSIYIYSTPTAGQKLYYSTNLWGQSSTSSRWNQKFQGCFEESRLFTAESWWLKPNRVFIWLSCKTKEKEMRSLWRSRRRHTYLMFSNINTADDDSSAQEHLLDFNMKILAE